MYKDGKKRTVTLEEVLTSIESLVESIKSCKDRAVCKGDSELVDRLEVYEDITSKQMKFYYKLELAMNGEDWLEFDRLTKLISGLSELLSSDARDILSKIRD